MFSPKLVAILNVTPDSFSGEGVLSTNTVLEKAEVLIREGAEVLDVGAESTRPDATPLSPNEEWERLAPVWSALVALCAQRNVLLSLDSYHPETVAKAFAIGGDWVNDVTGFGQEAMIKASTNAKKLVVMHSLSVPAVKGEWLPEETDIVEYMKSWAQSTVARLQEAGVSKERVLIDPGLGFGTSPKQCLELLKRVDDWRCNMPLFIGHSRKSFLSLFTDKPAQERDCLTRLVSSVLCAQKVDYLRVHDMAGHHAMFKGHDNRITRAKKAS